eukprot:905965-Alexandrium_andersonii.AAC.1
MPSFLPSRRLDRSRPTCFRKQHGSGSRPLPMSGERPARARLPRRTKCFPSPARGKTRALSTRR